MFSLLTAFGGSKWVRDMHGKHRPVEGFELLGLAFCDTVLICSKIKILLRIVNSLSLGTETSESIATGLSIGQYFNRLRSRVFGKMLTSSACCAILTMFLVLSTSCFLMNRI